MNKDGCMHTHLEDASLLRQHPLAQHSEVVAKEGGRVSDVSGEFVALAKPPRRSPTPNSVMFATAVAANSYPFGSGQGNIGYFPDVLLRYCSIFEVAQSRICQVCSSVGLHKNDRPAGSISKLLYLAFELTLKLISYFCAV